MAVAPISFVLAMRRRNENWGARHRDLRQSLEDATTDDDRERRGRFLRAATETFDDAVEAPYGVSDDERALLRHA